MRMLFTIAVLAWGTSSAAQPRIEQRSLDARSAFSDGQLVLSDPNAPEASKAAAREVVRAAGLALRDSSSRSALRQAGLIDACTQAIEEARAAQRALAHSMWKKVPAACGPARPETIAAYAALARSVAPPSAHFWWSRVLESYAASVPWSRSFTQGTTADDVADAYLDMVDARAQKILADAKQLPHHSFVDVLTGHDASGAQPRPGLARALWDEVRGVQATLVPVRNLDSPCGNASADQLVAVLLDALTRSLGLVVVPLYSQATSIYVQQIATGRAALPPPPPTAMRPLPQFEEKRAMQLALAVEATTLYASALLRGGETCPARLAPSRKGLAYLAQAFEGRSACSRLGLGDAQCTEGGLAWVQLGVGVPQDPLPLPSPAVPGG